MSPAELKVLVLSPSVKNWPILLGAGLLVMVTGFVGLAVLSLNPATAMSVSALGVALTVWPALSCAHTEYCVTNLRLLCRSGVLRKSESSMAVADIRDVRVVRSATQQALGIGDVEIVGASGSLRFAGVDDPEQVRERIATVR